MADPLHTKADNALIACQELHKKLRLLRNRGEATDLEVDLAAEAIEAVDIDSRAKRRGRPPAGGR